MMADRARGGVTSAGRGARVRRGWEVGTTWGSRLAGLVALALCACGGELVPPEASGGSSSPKGGGEAIPAGCPDDACVGGACSPVLLAPVVEHLSEGPVLTSRFVYYVDWYEDLAWRLLRVPKCGGEVAALAEGKGAPRGITATADQVYLSISSAPSGALWVASDDEPDARVIVAGVANPGEIVVDDARLYWTSSHGVETAPREGGAASSLIEDSAHWFGPIVGDEVRLYWVMETVWGEEARVQSIAKTGGSVTELAQTGVIRHLLVDETSLFGVDLGPGDAPKSLLRIPKGGGAPSMLWHGLMTSSIVADGHFIYAFAIVEDETAIWRVAKSGGPPSKVVDAGPYIAFPAIDATGLYWMDATGLQRLPSAALPSP